MRLEHEPILPPVQHPVIGYPSRKVAGDQPIDICYTFALGHPGGVCVDDFATTRGKHDLHVDKSYRQLLRVERVRGE